VMGDEIRPPRTPSRLYKGHARIAWSRKAVVDVCLSIGAVVAVATFTVICIRIWQGLW
jgi:hypothetical protein